jgi:DNA-directed RNA polymerase specialized sigma24 family protein
MLKFECPPDLNLFSEVDHLIVRQAMALLTRRQLKAITLRYWERLSETEICIAMNTDWRTVERLIGTAYEKLKEICLSQPQFSRARVVPLPARSNYQVEVTSYAS